MRRIVLHVVMIGFVVERVVQSTMLTIRHRITMRVVVVNLAVIRSMVQIHVMSIVVLLCGKVPAERSATQEHCHVRGVRGCIENGQHA